MEFVILIIESKDFKLITVVQTSQTIIALMRRVLIKGQIYINFSEQDNKYKTLGW
jgi:hypothetical protein